MTTRKVASFLKDNAKIEVRLEGNKNKYYKSIVHGVKGERFLIDPPYSGKDHLLLHLDDKVEVILLTDKEKYMFTATVVDRVQSPISGYVLQAPEEAKRIQLRDFVRIKLALEVEWAELRDGLTDHKELEELAFKGAIMVDLGGGGAGLVTDVPIPEGTQILLRCSLVIRDVKRVMNIFSEVRRCYRMDDRNKYAIGIAFVGLSEREQDQIIEYVFLRQRKQLLLDDGVN